MKADKWPFRPLHITNDGDKYKGTTLEKLDGVGIIPNECVQGIQKVICASLENPTTIVEFTCEGEFVGTDSGIVAFTFRPACKALRDATDAKYCRACDWAHAGLFHRLAKEEFCVKVMERIKKSSYIKGYRGSDKELHFRFVKSGKRPYLEYDCPLLGCRELLFPIFFEDRVIGAFLCGGLVLKDRMQFIERRQLELVKYYPSLVEVLGGQEKASQLVKTIVEKDLETVANRNWRGELCTVGHYRSMILNIKEGLGKLEGILQEQMDNQRRAFVGGAMEKEIETFRKNLSIQREAEEDQSRLDLLWKNMGRRLDSIRRKFDIKNVVVFGIKEIGGGPNRELEQVGAVGDFFSDFEKSLKSAKFDLRGLDEECFKKPTSSVTKDELFDAFGALSEGLRKGDYRVRFFPGSLSTQPGTAILIGYNKDNPGSSKENEPGGHLDRAIQSFYTVVSSVFASVRADISEECMKGAFKFWGHETGQLTAGLDSLRLLHLSTAERIMSLTAKEAENAATDVEAFWRQLYLLSIRPNLILAPPVPKRDDFYPYGEILCKWEKICRLDALRKRVG